MSKSSSPNELFRSNDGPKDFSFHHKLQRPDYSASIKQNAPQIRQSASTWNWRINCLLTIPAPTGTRNIFWTSNVPWSICLSHSSFLSHEIKGDGSSPPCVCIYIYIYLFIRMYRFKNNTVCISSILGTLASCFIFLPLMDSFISRRRHDVGIAYESDVWLIKSRVVIKTLNINLIVIMLRTH